MKVEVEQVKVEVGEATAMAASESTAWAETVVMAVVEATIAEAEFLMRFELGTAHRRPDSRQK